MSQRRVWSPLATKMELVTSRLRVAMAQQAGGWWSVDLGPELSQSDYAYSIDGARPVPDPRSLWQPDGVHGCSRPVDHSSFEWSDAGWQQQPLSAAIIYECHIGTFTPAGTFDSAIERLGHLRDLGITHVEIMPVAEFAGSRGWGYDGVDLYAPHHSYGGPDGLKRLVNACHTNRLGVILDVVYNHLGPDGNYLGKFGPYLTDRYTTPWGQAVNLDGVDSFEVRRFFCDNALMWLRDYHLDGLRIDAVHAIFDTCAIHFLEQLSAEVEVLAAALGRHLVLIAESDLNQPRIVVPREAGGYGIDAQWNEDFHHALHALFTGERDGYYQDFGSLADLAKALTRAFVYDGTYSRYRRRIHGRPPVGLSGHRFVGCLQNHDQIGNRARGERLGHLISADHLKIASAILLGSPFVPMLFQGEEWNTSAPFQYFADHDNHELAEAVRSGRRREFAGLVADSNEIPDPESPATFDRCKLAWSELHRPEHREILEWYRSLIALRRRVTDFTDGRLWRTAVSFDETAPMLCIRRGECVIACNLANENRRLPIESRRPLDLALASKAGARLVDASLELPPVSVAIALPAAST